MRTSVGRKAGGQDLDTSTLHRLDGQELGKRKTGNGEAIKYLDRQEKKNSRHVVADLGWGDGELKRQRSEMIQIQMDLVTLDLQKAVSTNVWVIVIPAGKLGVVQNEIEATDGTLIGRTSLQKYKDDEEGQQAKLLLLASPVTEAEIQHAQLTW